MKKIFKCIVQIRVIILFGLCFQAYAQDALQKTSDVSQAQSRIPKLLDLGAKKCIPCKKMAPILAEMEKTFKGVLEVEFVDVWQPENKQRALKHKVKSIPTQIFFDSQGVELWRHVGFLSREDILGKWKELGYVFKPAVLQ